MSKLASLSRLTLPIRTHSGRSTMTIAAAAFAMLTVAPGAMAQMDIEAGTQAREADEAEQKSLMIGDPAPEIDVEHWIKGDEVSKFKDDNIYVVEFWATWCPPCRTSMPHLSDLQQKYKDQNVHILGISDEDETTVSQFLTSDDWPEKTQYTLATDPDRSVFRDYMTAAGKSGIPTAFIVGRDQKIEWIGHPMSMDEPLQKVVAGEWDAEAY
ncbi:MAG: redoxin domain-containing protein, partial [Planctomycetota bacterium]